MPAVAAFLTFVTTVVLLLSLRPVAVALGLVDIPGGRKRHETPVPLLGGICMSIGLGLGTALIEHPAFWTPAIFAIYLLVVVGTVDDRFDLPPNVRLVAQVCASLLVVFPSNIKVTELGAPWFFDLPLGVFAVPFTVLFIVTLVNAFNLIDGLDGLAGGLALIAISAMSIVAAGSEVFGLTLILIAVVSAFLVFNFPVSLNRSVRTFMGDAGSTFLGLSIASIGIWLSQGADPRISPVVGLWLVAVPVFDLFSTVARRLMERRSPFSPDHKHMHHVLIEEGLSRRSSMVFMLSLAVVFVAIGLVGRMLKVADGIMLLGWFGAGAFYYQTMRRPRFVVRAVRVVLVSWSRAIRTLRSKPVRVRTRARLNDWGRR